MEVELWHMEGRQVSRSGQSLMTSISGPEGQIDLKIGGIQTRMIINQDNKSRQNRRRSCTFHPVFVWFDMECPLKLYGTHRLMFKN